MPAAGAVYAVAAYCAQYRNPQKNELINGKTDYIGKERKRKDQTDQAAGQTTEKGRTPGSRNFEEMLAYVDENGVLHTTPPEVGEREEIDASQIEVSVPRRSEPEEIVPFEGRVEYFDAAKGYGFIRNSDNGEKYFFHITQAPAAIAEGNRVTFELERGTRGMNAVRVAISDK